MRRYSVTYSNEIYEFLYNHAKDYTIKELVKILNDNFGLEIERKKLAQYCIKSKIAYKYEKPKKAHDNKPTKIGTIANKTDGDILKIKVGNHKWEYLQRKIYEDYYNLKLKDDEYIIFLDQNRRNFNIDNLKLVTRKESAMLSSQKLYSESPKVTELGITSIKLYNQIKNVDKLKMI